jgi:hypothetical protein
MNEIKRLMKWVVGLALVSFPALAATMDANEWAFLDNGQIRIGVKKTSGACIGWFSQSGSNRNLLNHHDQGRFVQQSFYGDEDGTLWNKQPWRWNPVQGGDWKGNPAKLETFRQTTNSIYARSLGRHWSGCVDLPDVVFEQWLSLTGRVAQIRYRMTYTGEHAHASRDHEIPAVFVEPDLDTLVLYDGDKPWMGGALSRSQPGWPNESRRMTEHWAAYVDKSDFGVGAFVAIATNLTCYRYAAGRSSAQGACSYFAPLIQFPVTPGKQFDYEVHLAIGKVTEIREAFRLSRSGPAGGMAPGASKSGAD